LRRTKSVKVGGMRLWDMQLALNQVHVVTFLNRNKSYRALNRSHRRLIGASTLMRRKKGRRRSTSSTSSSHTSVVTQRSLQLVVTKSSRLSESRNDFTSPSLSLVFSSGTLDWDSDFSTAGVGEVRSRRRGRKWCSFIKYDATADLPAHIPDRC
jgi:hypothetical protein